MKTFIISVLIVIPLIGWAQQDRLRRTHFNHKKNVALEGYDPVSYFNGGPKEGDEKMNHTHQGITYFFNSRENLNTFKLNPDKYEPAYGGWCAYAMGQTGEKVKVDPETFKIVEGKLFLFYNFWGNNTLEDWNANERKLKEAADRNWKNSLR
jgi:YHS domain-containing protein